MANRKNIIDGTLGDGWYDELLQLEDDVAQEKKRTALNVARFKKVSGTTDRLYWDMRLLERAAYDYNQCMNQLSGGQAVVSIKIKQIHGVLTLALGVIKHENDALDGAFAMGVLSGFVVLPVGVLQLRARNLQALLKELKPLLEKAKTERNEAWVKGALEVGLTAIILFGPPLGLLTRVGLGAGQWVLDDAIGPKTSNFTDTVDKSSIVASHFIDEVGEVERLSKKQKNIVKRTGQAVAVVGFAFDVHEVLVGYRNVDKIAKIMSDAKKAHADLLAEVTKHKPHINRFKQQLKRWQLVFKDARENAHQIRVSLKEEMKNSGYRPAY